MKERNINFIPGSIWIIIIFILLVMPGSDIPSNDFFELIYFDKWVHTGLFAVLTLFWCYPFLKYQCLSFKMLFGIGLSAILYGVAMEYVQKYFTTTRTFDLTDILADATGVLITTILFATINKSKK